MNAYEATLATAELFEREPKLFRFSETSVPDCGTPGCALGYIGYFMGQTGCISGESTIGVDSGVFYDRMRPLAPNWIIDASRCAKGLRLYAEKYLREDHIPTDVRAIFEKENTHERV
jgi:hypothetical protein